MLHVRRGSSRTEAQLLQETEYRSISDFAINNQFSVIEFRQRALEKGLDRLNPLSASTFRDVRQPNGKSTWVGWSTIGINHDGRGGMLPTHGRITPPRRKDREPFRWRGGNLF